MVYKLRFFSSKCSLFYNSNIFVSCVIHILYTGCAKIKKLIPAPKCWTASYVWGSLSLTCVEFWGSLLVSCTDDRIFMPLGGGVATPSLLTQYEHIKVWVSTVVIKAKNK